MTYGSHGKIGISVKTWICVLAIVLLPSCSGGDDQASNDQPSDPQTTSEQAPSAGGEITLDTALQTDIELKPVSNRVIARAEAPFTGDLDEIKERKYLRVLVSYSRTNFFFDQGVPRGYELDQIYEYEKALNSGIKNAKNRIRIMFVPTPFHRLIDDLEAGRGDVVAAGMTITPEREERVAFTDPYLPNVSEVVVAHKSVEGLDSLDALSGQRVTVRRGSSYVNHLKAVSEKMEERGIKGIEVVEADPNLATEDILELVNAGALKLTVADNHIAQLWSEMLPDIRVHNELAINSGGQIAWAVRKNNPKLKEDLNSYIGEHKKGSLLGNIFFSRYYKDNKWISNPLSQKEQEKLQKIAQIFQNYGDRYGIEWLKVVAQAYQESKLDHSKKSAAGAIGIMQVLPSTAAADPIGIADIQVLEQNVHAGVKYMNHIREVYFNDPAIDPAAQVDFAWAAYNAGPTRISKLRKQAAERGLDPNKWFDNVEELAAERIGRETVDYVRNINKYYVAYQLAYELDQLAAVREEQK